MCYGVVELYSPGSCCCSLFFTVKRSLIIHFGRFSTEERKIVDGIQLKFILFSITYFLR